MSQWEWVRTARAVEQAGSITAGARDRHLSQPAASQQIQALERSLGIDLFERHRSGVRPTADGARFLAQISAPFDEIEWLLDGLGGGRVTVPDVPVVVGCQPEWFEKSFLPHYELDVPIRARFGRDAEVLDDLQAGRVDVAVTRLSPPAAQAESVVFGRHRYVLVAAPALVSSAPPQDRDQLAAWIRATPWVGFSEELPTTRRFWSDVTGSVQPTRIALVAPDLRIVSRAVERGMGASLLPGDVCQEALVRGELVEVFDVAELLPQESWVVSTKRRRHPPSGVTEIVDAIVRSGETPRLAP